MESLLQSFPFLVTCLIAIFMFMLPKTLRAITRSIKTKSTPSLPPGPWTLPLIGNLHQLIGDLPHYRLRDLAKKHGPLMRLQLGEVPHVIVSSPEVAKEMMKTHDANFSQRPHLLVADKYNGIDIVFTNYGDYWRMMKRICTEELLSIKRIQSFRLIREEEVSNLIAEIRSSSGTNGLEPVNLSRKIFSLTYGITAGVAFGKKCTEQEAFISAVGEAVKIASAFSLAEAFPSQKWLVRITGLGSMLEKNVRTIDKIFDNIIDGHKLEDNQCLLDVLLNLQNTGELPFPLEKINIKAVMLDVFTAGSETISTVTEWAMLELLKNPRIMDKAQAEVRQVFHQQGNVDETGLYKLKYLNMVIKETLRLHPPTPLTIPRESKESCVINGYYVPAKTRMIVNTHVIARDPRYWTEPEKFYPERFVDNSVDFKGTNFEFIPFGAGRRICPGISFAIAGIEITLAQLLFHFNWKLPNGASCENIDITEAYGITVRRKAGDVYLIPVPYGGSVAHN